MSEENKIKITHGWIIYFIISNLIVLIGGIYQKSGLMSIISSVAGVAYVLLVAKERRIAFIFGAVNVLLYGLILLKESVYGGVIYKWYAKRHDPIYAINLYVKQTTVLDVLGL